MLIDTTTVTVTFKAADPLNAVLTVAVNGRDMEKVPMREISPQAALGVIPLLDGICEGASTLIQLAELLPGGQLPETVDA